MSETMWEIEDDSNSNNIGNNKKKKYKKKNKVVILRLLPFKENTQVTLQLNIYNMMKNNFLTV